MKRRDAYMLAVGSKAVDWFTELSHQRARRCVAFLLLYGVISTREARLFETRIADAQDARERRDDEEERS